MHCWRPNPALKNPLKTQPSTRDHRNVKYHFCNTTAQEILIHICKDKWPKSICETNSQRLLQEPAAKQLPPSLIVREEMKPWEAAGYPFAISSSVLLCPHFSCSCALLRQMSSFWVLSLQDMEIDHLCSNLVFRQFSEIWIYTDREE